MTNLTFETFNNFFEEVKKIWDYEDALNALNWEYRNDSTVYPSIITGGMITAAINCIAANFNNPDVVADNIDWWIFETKMGEDYASIWIDDEEICFKTTEDLWNFLIENYGEQKWKA